MLSNVFAGPLTNTTRSFLLNHSIIEFRECTSLIEMQSLLQK